MNINKVEELFEFQVLFKILGPLNYQVLKTPKNELKSYAVYIDSNLGGGANEHIRLILMYVEHALVYPTASYIWYVMQSTPIFYCKKKHMRQLDYKMTKRRKIFIYRDIFFRKDFIKKLSKHMPTMYLKQFQNKHNNVLDKSVSEVLGHSFLVYWQVPKKELDKVESKLSAHIFDISEPLVIMYNERDDLKDMTSTKENAFF